MLDRLNRIKLLLAFALLGSLSYAVHAVTAANTIINNQATASYTDSANTARIITSNRVQTTIQQVAGLTLTSPQSKPGAGGASIIFPHILTNTGNGIDRYNLSVDETGLVDDYDFVSLTILPDADGNGVPDSQVAITQTPELDTDDVYAFVVQAVLPAALTDTQIGQFNVNATSVFNSGVEADNQDEVVISDRAIIDVIKSISENSGEAGSGTYRVNLTYNNFSNDIATNVTVIDQLPAEMLYAGNAVWSLGDVALSDADILVQGSGEPSIVYCAYDNSCNVAPYSNTQVTFLISAVGAGQSGTVSFDVSIDAAALPSVIFNTAQYLYDDSVSVTSAIDSNTVPFEIIPTAAVSLVGFTAADSQPGQTVSFDNVITNNGNAIDTFDISLDRVASNFPSGTVYNLYMADGFTPLADTNGDGVADTGPLNPGESVSVIMQAIIPANAAIGTYSIDKTASSNNLATVTDTGTDTVTIVLPVLGIDVTNNLPNNDPGCATASDNCGFGPGPSASPQTIEPVVPNNAGTYVLYANNDSDISDSYDITASIDPTFASTDLPLGWSIIYINDAGEAITNTGAIAAGERIRVRAIVSVPADFAAGLVSIFFRMQSPVTGTGDIKHDGVDVQEVEELLLSPDNVGQTSPGTFINYSHVLRNNGNTPQNNIALSATNSLASNGWTVLVYEDTNASGVFDSGDDQIAIIPSLAPGAEQLLFTRVFAPTSAGDSVTNLTTLTASFNAGVDSVSATDLTTVNPFNVDVIKRQALDADCDGEADAGPGSYTITTFTVAPGQCVVYEIDTQNNATEPVLNVIIFDATPAFTLYSSNQPSVRCQPAVCTFVSEPAANTNGTLEVQAGSLNAGDSVQLYFNVGLEQ